MALVCNLFQNSQGNLRSLINFSMKDRITFRTQGSWKGLPQFDHTSCKVSTLILPFASRARARFPTRKPLGYLRVLSFPSLSRMSLTSVFWRLCSSLNNILYVGTVTILVRSGILRTHRLLHCPEGRNPF